MTVANDERLLDRLTKVLAVVPGVRALVLGGSRGRGTATEDSDYDIGLYYEAALPLDVGALRQVVAMLDDRGAQAEITTIGGWGPWINGGGWLSIAGSRVDLLYRDLDLVSEVIGECQAGRFTCHYQPGHPHGFITTIYAAEVSCCRPLFDPHGVLQSLKQLTTPYPAKLRSALVARFLWEAQFALDNARHGRGRTDTNYTAGCCFRAVASLCQALAALNGEYLLNEKGAVGFVDRLPTCPSAFASRVAALFGNIGSGAPAAALDEAKTLIGETAALAKGA
jgi:predicted nucleotidyltransferase